MKREFEIQEIESVVKDFLKNLKEEERVLGFSGDLGSGKTTFTKELLKQLGHTGNVISPTFVLRRDYELSPSSEGGESHVDEPGRGSLIHIDAYRLEKPEQIYQIIGKGELEDKKNLIIIEWPEKVDTKLFDKIYHFQHISENKRGISTSL